MSKTSLIDDQMKQIWTSFAATYGSLRLFSEQMPALSDRLDEQSIEEMAEMTADTFGDPLEQVRAELKEFFPSLNEDHLYPDLLNHPDVQQTFATFHDTAFRRRVLKWEREKPFKAHSFITQWADTMAQPPLSGIVLRQSVLINLVSLLEIFVDSLLTSFHPDVAPEPEISEKLNWGKRWKYLEKPFPDEHWLPYKNTLREMIARRNGLVHQGGRITENGYLKQTKEIPSLRPDGAKEGRFLLVPSQYLGDAFDTSILFALMLSQSVWRKGRKTSHSKTADEIISNLVYQTLRQKRHTLVEKLAEATLNFSLKNKYRQLVQVNWAIACREQEKRDDMRLLIEKLERQKKRSWNISMAIAALREQNEDVDKFLKDAAQKGKLKEISLHWPLFDPIRDESWFKNRFAARYGQLPKSRRTIRVK